MDLLTIDFESYYDKEFSLSKMPTQAYIMDALFEVICVSVKRNKEPVKHFSGTMADTKAWLQQFDWANSMAIAHNSMFDGAILAFRFGIVPKMYFCTMMGARPWLAPFTPRGRTSLAALATHLNLQAKGGQVKVYIGMRRIDFGPAQLRDYMGYCDGDVDICFDLAMILLRKFNSVVGGKDELKLIDGTIRKFTQPQMVLDYDVIEIALAKHKLMKQSILAKAGLQTRELLMSNDKFAAALKLYGVSPPTKISPRTGKTAYAFAKTDKGMKELLEHPEPAVQALVAARMAHKSTIAETRMIRFLGLARLKGKFSVPLLYYGAHTGRLAGWDKLNLQNLNRGSELRRSITAPPGFKVVAGDLSSIEARMVATLAGQHDLVQDYHNGVDVYCKFATRLFGREIKNVPKDFNERFLGKTTVLGAGYGTGGEKLFLTVQASGKVEITRQEAHRIIEMYRTSYPKIPELWKEAKSWLVFMAQQSKTNFIMEYGPLRIHTNFKNSGSPAIELPNGMPIYYPNLSWDRSANQFSYMSRTGLKTTWGGAVIENVCQALARIVISRAELFLNDRGYYASNQVHDELIYVIAEAMAKKFAVVLDKVLSRPVSWLPNLPIAAECGIGDNYAEAK